MKTFQTLRPTFRSRRAQKWRMDTSSGPNPGKVQTHHVYLVPSENITLPTRPIVVLCILEAWERSPTTFKNKITQIARTGRHEAPATASPQGHGWLDRNISWSNSLRLFQKGWTLLYPIISNASPCGHRPDCVNCWPSS